MIDENIQKSNPIFRVESVVILTEAVYTYSETCQKRAVYTEHIFEIDSVIGVQKQ